MTTGRILGERFGDVGALATLQSAAVRPPTINDYDPIAPAFDDVMGFDFHAATHSIREAVAGELARDGALTCIDLCAGTGLFLQRLSTQFSVQGWGIDLSGAQIELARARVKNGPVRYEIGDVVQAALPGGVDLVTINFDALNHVSGAADWHTVVSKAYRALRLGGAFLCDINLPDRLAKDWDAPEVIVKDSVTYIQLSHPSVWTGSAVRRQTPMIIYQQTLQGAFVRRDALIEQFAIPLREVLELLAAVGFSKTTVLQDGDPRPRGHIFNKNRAFIAAWR